MKFEYTCVVRNASEDVVVQMNDYGARGWEVCGVAVVGMRVVVYFKREVIPV